MSNRRSATQARPAMRRCAAWTARRSSRSLQAWPVSHRRVGGSESPRFPGGTGTGAVVLALVVPLAVIGCGQAGERPATHTAPTPGTAPAITGFTAASAARERAAEQRFLAGVSPDQVSAFHRNLTAAPHRATSPRNTELARWIAERWRAQGWDDVTLPTYQAYFSEPQEISLEMVSPVRVRAGLREDSYEIDPQSRNPDISGAYSAFSASGDVTAEVVYARGGDPEDYDVLREHGISVTGKIVLVRYAYPYSFRGFKAMTAERAGASAVVFYSDP